MKHKQLYLLTAALIVTFILSSVNISAQSQTAAGQHIIRRGSNNTLELPDAWFTGKARMTQIYSADSETTFSAAYVSFEPGARTAWHIHSGGQRLIVTEGVGWTQEWGKPKVEIRAGDAVVCPAGIKHWHGASAHSPMTHIALTGPNGVQWLEKVSDAQYIGN